MITKVLASDGCCGRPVLGFAHVVEQVHHVLVIDVDTLGLQLLLDVALNITFDVTVLISFEETFVACEL